MALLWWLAARADAGPRDNVALGGFFDFEVEKTLIGLGGDPNGSFDLHHFNVVSSWQVADRLVVRGHVELEHAFSTEGGGALTLEYAFAELTGRPWLRFRAGRMNSPFGLYNEVHDSSPAWVTYRVPEVLYEPDDLGFAEFVPKWHTGVSVLGDLAVGRRGDLHYDLWLSNGQDVIGWDGESDDNAGKGVGLTVRASPSRSLSAVVTGYVEPEPRLRPGADPGSGQRAHAAFRTASYGSCGRSGVMRGITGCRHLPCISVTS